MQFPSEGIAFWRFICLPNRYCLDLKTLRFELDYHFDIRYCRAIALNQRDGRLRISSWESRFEIEKWESRSDSNYIAEVAASTAHHASLDGLCWNLNLSSRWVVWRCSKTEMFTWTPGLRRSFLVAFFLWTCWAGRAKISSQTQKSFRIN